MGMEIISPNKLNRVQNDLMNMAPAALRDLEMTCRLDSEDHWAIHDYQAVAYANGRLPLDLAMWVSSTLGNSAESFNGKRLAERLVVLEVVTLLRKKEYDSR